MNLAIITGGSKGLGAAIVSQLAEKQWKVFELSRSGTTKHNIQCDLADSKSVEAACESLFARLALQDWDQIVLINNAAQLQPIKFTGSFVNKEIERNLRINQISAFTIISEFIKIFQNKDSHKLIVNVSSGAALKGYAGWSLYCASKAGCENFINSIAAEQEYERFPFIPVNYDPGIMDTDMQVSIRDADISDFPQKERFVSFKNDGDLKAAHCIATQLIKLITSAVQPGKRYSMSA